MCQDPWQLNFNGGVKQPKRNEISIETRGQRNQFIGMVAMPNTPMPTQPPMPETMVTTMQPRQLGCSTVVFGRVYPFVDDDLKAFGTSFPILETDAADALGAVEEGTSSLQLSLFGPSCACPVAPVTEDMFFDFADFSEFFKGDVDDVADAEEEKEGRRRAR